MTFPEAGDKAVISGCGSDPVQFMTTIQHVLRRFLCMSKGSGPRAHTRANR